MPLGEINYEGKLPYYLPFPHIESFAVEEIPTNPDPQPALESLRKHKLAILAGAIDVDASELMAVSEAYLRVYGGKRDRVGFKDFPKMPVYRKELGNTDTGKVIVHRGGTQGIDVAMFEFTGTQQFPYVTEQIWAETRFKTDWWRYGPVRTSNVKWKILSTGRDEIAMPSNIYGGNVKFENRKAVVGIEEPDQVGLRKVVERLWDISHGISRQRT
jgi:hypothetical protein